MHQRCLKISFVSQKDFFQQYLPEAGIPHLIKSKTASGS